MLVPPGPVLIADELVTDEFTAPPPTRSAKQEQRQSRNATSIAAFHALAWRLNDTSPRGPCTVQAVPGQVNQAMAWLLKVCRHQPGLLAQWQLGAFTAALCGAG